MPKNPNIIATRTAHGPVYIFDRTKHTSTPNADGVCRPDIRLEGHDAEGYDPFVSRELYSFFFKKKGMERLGIQKQRDSC